MSEGEGKTGLQEQQGILPDIPYHTAFIMLGEGPVTPHTCEEGSWAEGILRSYRPSFCSWAGGSQEGTCPGRLCVWCLCTYVCACACVWGLSVSF